MTVISDLYMALIDKNKLDEMINYNVFWLYITKLENDKKIYLALANGNELLKFVIGK